MIIQDLPCIAKNASNICVGVRIAEHFDASQGAIGKEQLDALVIVSYTAGWKLYHDQLADVIQKGGGPQQVTEQIKRITG